MGSNLKNVKKVLYTRVSSAGQNVDRQKVAQDKYDVVIEDVCSGSVPMVDRDGGSKIFKLVDSGIVFELHVWTIDRLGRDLRDILNTIHRLTKHNVNICFVQQGINTLDANGKESAVAKLVVSLLGVVGEMERNFIKERQLEGIALAKLKGVYKGRKRGSSESDDEFLEKHRKAVKLLRLDYKVSEVAKICSIHVNTVRKIKRKLGA